MFVDGYWYWICVGALMGFSLLFNICFIMALVYLDCKLFLLVLTFFLFFFPQCFSHGIIIQQLEWFHLNKILVFRTF